jgi:hypothetical protein
MIVAKLAGYVALETLNKTGGFIHHKNFLRFRRKILIFHILYTKMLSVEYLSSQVGCLEDDIGGVHGVCGLIDRDRVACCCGHECRFCLAQREPGWWIRWDRDYQNAIEYIQKILDVFNHLNNQGFSTVGEVLRIIGNKHPAIHRVLRGNESVVMHRIKRRLEDNERLDSIVIPTLTEILSILGDRRETCAWSRRP